jgi:hypothetical protein
MVAQGINTSFPELASNVSHLTTLIEVQDKDGGYLNKSRKNMAEILAFGRSVVPKSRETSDAIFGLVEEFRVQGKANFKTGTENVTCMIIKCLYAPIKNAICYDFLTGAAFWLVTSLTMLSGLAVLEVSWCIRRRTLAPKPQVDDSDDEEDDDDDDEHPLSDFGPGKG